MIVLTGRRASGATALGPSAPATRDRSVETLRGLACLLVVGYHVLGSQPTNGLRLDSDSPWAYAVESLVYVRMPLFTFLSGVVYALRPARSGYGAFLRGKSRRLLVPMLFIGTAFAVTQVVVPGVNYESDRPWYLWHIYPVGHYWFLESVLVAFVVVALLEKLRLLDTLRSWAVVTAIAVAADVALPEMDNVLGLRMGVYLLPFFLVGLAVTRFDWRSAPPALKYGAVVLAVLLLGVTQLGLLDVIPAVPERHSLVATALGITACLALFLVRRSVGWLAVIGGFSFTIYTCHVFGTAAARLALRTVGVDAVPVHVLVGMAAGVTAGVVVELVARRSALGSFLVLGKRLART